MGRGIQWIASCLAWLLFLSTPALAYDEVKCASANARAASTSSEYGAARTAYDYCQRYGDTSGTGYGSTDCNAAYYRMQEAKASHDEAVSAQWQYCY